MQCQKFQFLAWVESLAEEMPLRLLQQVLVEFQLVLQVLEIQLHL